MSSQTSPINRPTLPQKSKIETFTSWAVNYKDVQSPEMFTAPSTLLFTLKPERNYHKHKLSHIISANQQIRKTQLTCWKLFTVFPILLPTSGNFLGPKTRAATPAITTSSGTPNPNSALQVKPLLPLLAPLLEIPTTKEPFLALQDAAVLILFERDREEELVKKAELKDVRGREGSWGSDEEGGTVRDEEISMVFASRFPFSFFFSGFYEDFSSRLCVAEPRTMR